MSLLLLAFLGIAYAHTGHQLGKKGWKIWKKKDNRTKKSMLFFPLSNRRRTVGKAGLTLFRADGDGVDYKLFVTFFWPLLVAWNATVLGTYILPDKALTALLKKRPSLRQLEARRQLVERNADRVLERQFDQLEERQRQQAAIALPPEPAPAPALEAAKPVTPKRRHRPKRKSRPATPRVRVDAREERAEEPSEEERAVEAARRAGPGNDTVH